MSVTSTVPQEKESATPTLPCLFNASVITDALIHYAEEPRDPCVDIDIQTRYCSKCHDALHFGRNTEWRDGQYVSRNTRDYKYKYKLDRGSLKRMKILEVSRRTIIDLLPLPLASWGFDWRALRERGYDGVWVDWHSLFQKKKDRPELPPGYGRWREFAYKFDIDTLVVWRGAVLVELPNDWPALSDEDRVEYDKRKDYFAQRKVDIPGERAARALLMATLPETERRLRRNSMEKEREDNEIEVEQLRKMFPGYDEHYPVRLPK